MCRFITAILPAGADIAALRAIARRHQRDLRPQANPDLPSQLARGDQCYLTTVGHCDCDSALGRARDACQPDDDIGRWRRKGWTEAKIARALRQRGENRHHQMEAQILRMGPDLARWQALLADVLRNTGADGFGLLIHHYAGNLDESFALRSALTIRQSEITAHLLASLEEDTPYRFRRD